LPTATAPRVTAPSPRGMLTWVGFEKRPIACTYSFFVSSVMWRIQLTDRSLSASSAAAENTAMTPCGPAPTLATVPPVSRRRRSASLETTDGRKKPKASGSDCAASANRAEYKTKRSTKNPRTWPNDAIDVPAVTPNAPPGRAPMFRQSSLGTSDVSPDGRDEQCDQLLEHKFRTQKSVVEIICRRLDAGLVFSDPCDSSTPVRDNHTDRFAWTSSRPGAMAKGAEATRPNSASSRRRRSRTGPPAHS